MADILDRTLNNKEDVSAAWSEYEAAVQHLYRLNSTLVYTFYECGIDFQKMENKFHLLTSTKWASPAFVLRFLWNGARVVMHPRHVIHSWARDVLFGNIQAGNRIADVFLVLAENYEALRKSRIAAMKPRERFLELET